MNEDVRTSKYASNNLKTQEQMKDSIKYFVKKIVKIINISQNVSSLVFSAWSFWSIIILILTELSTTSLAVKRLMSLAVKRFKSLAVKRFTSLAVKRSTSLAVKWSTS